MTNRNVLVLLVLFISFCGLLLYFSNLKTEHSANGLESDALLKASPKAERQRRGDHVRHCTTDRILGKALSGLQTVPFEISNKASPEIAENRKSSFETIFKNKVWIAKGDRDKEHLASGPGSTLDFAQEVMATLHSIISQLKQELGVDRIRLLDIPCGDMVWMSRFLKTRDDVHYTGFDIVPDLIERHRKNYVGQNNWTFRVQDIVRDGLNESYDLILCRMMLQHLFNQDALTVIKHFSESGSRYLLTTTFSRASGNSDLPAVDTRFRELNLELPPFSLTPPICFLRDGDNSGVHGTNHFLGLWQLPVRRVKLCSTASFKIPGFGVDFFSCTNWS